MNPRSLLKASLAFLPLLLAAPPLSAAAPEAVSRVRLGSLEPDMLTPDMLDRLAAQPKLCPHFHISLQSGCDETLQRMNRRYDTAVYEVLCEQIRARFESCAITTDIMVGFPGETEEEFGQSLAFFRGIGFAGAHVFAYSRRPETPAYNMPGQLTRAVKAERSRLLKATAEQAREAFLRSQVGKTAQVLIENRRGGICGGYSEDYSPVEIAGGSGLRAGDIVTVKITGVADGKCVGAITG